MTDPKYRYIGSPSTRLIEELAELIMGITKAQRFGLDNFHPRDPHKISNREHIKHEMQDVRRLMTEYEEKVLGDPVEDTAFTGYPGITRSGRTDVGDKPE